MADLKMCPSAATPILPEQEKLNYCSLPQYQPKEDFISFLHNSAAGGTLGAGIKLEHLGKNVPLIRDEYKRLLMNLETQIQEKAATGMPLEQLAEWASGQRREIANTVRRSEGIAERAIEVARDTYHYGLKGRTPENIRAHYAAQGISESQINQKIIQGAVKSNASVSKFASTAAHYFKNGGRAVLALGAGLTTYEIASAKPEDRERVIYEQAGGFAGGYAVSGGAAYGCFLFGVTTGWGLIGCALLGGVAGGVGGGAMGDMLYFAKRPEIEREIKDGVLDFSAVSPVMPKDMCVAR